MRKQVLAAAAWVRAERERLGWSVEELARRADAIASDMGWEGLVPSAAEIEALGAERLKSLPRWFKLIRYAIERAGVPDAEALAWLAERNTHWQRDEPLRMSRPLLFDEEDRILKKIQKLDTDEQRAIRAFISDFADRQCYDTKEEMVRRLLKRLGIGIEALARAPARAGQCPG
ncbi:MAG: hypothetical protein ACT4N8_03850 [Sphingosinicella sp.]|uniref:hypothetical protein n=1 Tax=Sphingosinicella sp. TaxID=1917971 RepID=UPI0040379372